VYVLSEEEMDVLREMIPTQFEVLAQLQKLLESGLFLDSAAQSALLEFVVKSAYVESELDEHQIGFAIFQNYDPKSHKVRSTATIVRKKLLEYYETTGSQDLVEIVLPPGRSYQAVFTYRLHHETLRAYRRGMALLSQPHTHQSLYSAAEAFKKAYEKTFFLAPAFARMGEAIMWTPLYQELFGMRPIGDDFDEAQQCLARAVSLDPDCWIAQEHLAALHLLGGNWANATRHFADAQRISLVRTFGSLWFAAYLVSMSKLEKGCELALSLANANPENPGLRIGAAFLLYLGRQYRAAMRVLDQTDADGFLFDIREILMVLLHFACGEFRSALSAFTEPDRNARAGFARSPDFPLLERAGPNAFWGVNVACHAKVYGEASARQLFTKISTGRRQSPSLQFAIGLMSIGDHGRALVALRRACYREGSVFYGIIHLMQIFEPLMPHPRFVRMVNALNAVNDKSLRASTTNSDA
jgi:tetratricopeptide (TPR) repeat protein